MNPKELTVNHHPKAKNSNDEFKLSLLNIIGIISFARSRIRYLEDTIDLKYVQRVLLLYWPQTIENNSGQFAFAVSFEGRGSTGV